MLRQRVVTALIMAGLFLAAVVFLPLVMLDVLFAAIVCLGAWEWSRLAGWRHWLARALYVLVLAAAMAGLYSYCRLGEGPSRVQVQPFLGLACLWWSFALLWIRGYPGSALLWRSVAVRSAMGLLILAPAWMAAAFLLSFPRGGLLMVILIVVVATADIGAYFTGKTWGRHKLAVRVSPAKTWEGFWGGMLACAVLAGLLWRLLPDQVAHIGLT